MIAIAFASAALFASLMPDVVVIELTPHDGHAAAVIAESCSEALGETPCVVEEAVGAPETPASEGPALEGPGRRQVLRARVQLPAEGEARAVIRFEDGADGARVARTIEFTASDPRDDRLRAIGLVIAAQTLERARPGAPADAPAEPPPSPADASSPTTPEETHARWLVDVGPLLGPGLDQGPLRLGGFLRVGLQPDSDVPLGVLVSLRGAATLGAPDVLWTSMGIGAFAQVDVAPRLAVGLRVEGFGQRALASATDAGSGRELSGDALRPGARVDLDLVLELGASAALLAGLDATFMKRLVLAMGEREVGREGTIRLAAIAGFRLLL